MKKRFKTIEQKLFALSLCILLVITSLAIVNFLKYQQQIQEEQLLIKASGKEELFARLDNTINTHPNSAFASIAQLTRNQEVRKIKLQQRPMVNITCDSLDECKQVGRLLHNAAMFKESVNIYKQASLFNDQDAELYLLQSIGLYKLTRFDEALKVVNRAIEIEPESISINFQKGLILSALNQNLEALSLFDRIIEQKEDYFQAYKQKILILQRLGRHEELTKLEEQERLMSTFYQGLYLMKQNQWKKAIVKFDEVLKLDSSFSRAYYKKAEAYRRLGLFESAIESYDKVSTSFADFDKVLRDRNRVVQYLRMVQN